MWTSFKHAQDSRHVDHVQRATHLLSAAWNWELTSEVFGLLVTYMTRACTSVALSTAEVKLGTQAEAGLALQLTR